MSDTLNIRSQRCNSSLRNIHWNLDASTTSRRSWPERRNYHVHGVQCPNCQIKKQKLIKSSYRILKFSHRKNRLQRRCKRRNTSLRNPHSKYGWCSKFLRPSGSRQTKSMAVWSSACPWNLMPQWIILLLICLRSNFLHKALQRAESEGKWEQSCRWFPVQARQVIFRHQRL